MPPPRPAPKHASAGSAPPTAQLSAKTPALLYPAGTLKPGGVYALVADSGKLLARCFGCFSGTYSNVATVHVPAPANLSLATVDPYARWVVQAIPKLSGQVRGGPQHMLRRLVG